jgi:hypothetical protein
MTSLWRAYGGKKYRSRQSFLIFTAFVLVKDVEPAPSCKKHKHRMFLGKIWAFLFSYNDERCGKSMLIILLQALILFCVQFVRKLQVQVLTFQKHARESPFSRVFVFFRKIDSFLNKNILYLRHIPNTVYQLGVHALVRGSLIYIILILYKCNQKRAWRVGLPLRLPFVRYFAYSTEIWRQFLEY